MTRKLVQKPAPKPNNPELYRRFVKAAREGEADESPGAMDRAFERVVGPKKPDQPAAQQPKRK